MPTTQEAEPETRADASAPPDVLPPRANRLLAFAWVALFGGRWILAPFLIGLGLMNAQEMAAWDNSLLLGLYLLLFVVTILVFVLRGMRKSSGAAAAPARRSNHRD